MHHLMLQHFQNLLECKSLLFLFIPETSKPDINYENLDFKNSLILITLMIFYGFFIQRIGFLISTSVFLLIAFYVLDERRKITFYFFISICGVVYVFIN